MPRPTQLTVLLVCMLGGGEGLAPAWQQDLVRGAPGIEANDLDSAAKALAENGVVRLNGIFERTYAQQLKSHLQNLREAAFKWNDFSVSDPDKLFVPGTRLRFDTAVEVAFAGARSDVLLPLRDPCVGHALQTACTALRPVIEECALRCLPRLEGQVGDSPLELVELASLLAFNGAGHQRVHHDYRRLRAGDDEDGDTLRRRGKMPPRLVTFLYLQDVPTVDYAPTVFLRKTATAEAHDRLDLDGSSRPAPEDLQGVCVATVQAGDAIIYDASVLHFGGANNVEGHERSIFYFGFSPVGGAAALAGEPPRGFTAKEPVLMRDVLTGACWNEKDTVMPLAPAATPALA